MIQLNIPNGTWWFIIAIFTILGIILIYFQLKNTPLLCSYCGDDITDNEINHYCHGKLSAIRAQKSPEGAFRGKTILNPHCTKCGLKMPSATIYDMVNPKIVSKTVFTICETCERNKKLS